MADNRDDKAKRSYPVGYKRPPIAHRFKPGQSGNPRGRRKQSKNLLTLLDEELNRPIMVKERGLERRMSKRQAIVMQIVANALKGDPKALDLLLRLQKANPPAEPFEFSPADDQEWEEFLKRQIASVGQDDGNESAEQDAEAEALDDDVPE